MKQEIVSGHDQEFEKEIVSSPELKKCPSHQEIAYLSLVFLSLLGS